MRFFAKKPELPREWRLMFACASCAELFEDTTRMPIQIAMSMPRLCPACEFWFSLSASKISFQESMWEQQVAGI